MSNIQPRLQYNYAKINLTTGECTSCGTFSYQINNRAYIVVPYATNDYMHKYYNINGDQMWYWDAAFTQLWEECPSHNT